MPDFMVSKRNRHPQDRSFHKGVRSMAYDKWLLPGAKAVSCKKVCELFFYFLFFLKLHTANDYEP